MTIDKSFLEDEIRLGFYIPSTIKQAWAAELEILSVIDKICRENSLKYFADWGTFLGAVRHGGFIPWDDDLDLVMLRDDYDRFLNIASSVLPEGYSVHTFRNEDDFVEFHAVVVNTSSARFDEEYYNQFHGFPYMCGVDIFVLDYVHMEEDLENQRVEDTLFIIAFADGMLANMYDSATIETNLQKIEKICHTKIDRNLSTKNLWIQLYELAERKTAEVPSDKSDILTQMVPWGLKKQLWRRYTKESYSFSTLLPFENTFIPVPLYYDKLLSQRYGDYMKIVKNGGAHDYPYFEKEKSTIETLLGQKINHYDFPNTIAPRENASEHWKSTVKECLDNLTVIKDAILAADENIVDYILDSQDLSIELGNYIESLKGENHVSVNSIERYCESLYTLYSSLSDNNINMDTYSSYLSDIASSYDDMVVSITQNVINKKEVVFLPFKSNNWCSFEAIYRKYVDDPEYDVYVVAIPYYYKGFGGALTDEQYDLASYDENLNVIPYDEFNLAFHHPDIICIQSPYDQYNATTSIHPDYYSSVIYQYTETLIYVPWFSTDNFTPEEVRSFKNMDQYTCMPGLVYSDRIILPSEILKETYISKLIKWAGEETIEYWSRKIEVISREAPTIIPDSGKTLLYYVGQGQPLQNADKFLSKLKNNLAILSQAELNVILFIPLELTNNIKNYYPDLIDQFDVIMSRYNDSSISIIHEIEQSTILECDAYYGDTSPVAIEFRYLGKPVMIQNYNI